MERQKILIGLQEIFRDVLNDNEIELMEDQKQSDFDQWDSLASIIIVSSIEMDFDMKYPMDEIVNMKSISAIIDVIERECRSL